jgi:hypothetical protein
VDLEGFPAALATTWGPLDIGIPREVAECSAGAPLRATADPGASVPFVGHQRERGWLAIEDPRPVVL